LIAGFVEFPTLQPTRDGPIVEARGNDSGAWIDFNRAQGGEGRVIKRELDANGVGGDCVEGIAK
jgi:hypothetical protein